jgi:hypothetical protein
VANWSAGKLSVATIETGVETWPRTPGWIVVNILRDKSLPGRCPKGTLTEREAYHAAVAYNRARGNTDQDVDPETMTPLSVIDGPLIEN